ncbi:hypothetical protein F5876DRAFT_70030 [Lentinula aff. lateritia]|uniref:Uncharacterized protein n=1 Tax=Lentinula aff. lateritia TaxID=2804960 RepID=A0ACC1TKY8_9AGAR|nr:hypothetical protein F5876DRAFT_70030 [Lentinula aff. lateritia]
MDLDAPALLFEHALRIRVKPDPSSSTTSVPANSKPPSTTRKSTQSKKIKSQAGLSNNLITTDLSNITELRNGVLILFQRPVEFVSSVVSLERILGWASTSVGINLMILLAPISAKIINAGRRLFVEQMRKTDVRVEVFGDAISCHLWRLPQLWQLQVAKVIQSSTKPSPLLVSPPPWSYSNGSNKSLFVNNRYYTGLISVRRIEEFLGEVIGIYNATFTWIKDDAEALFTNERDNDGSAVVSEGRIVSSSGTSHVSQETRPTRKCFLTITEPVIFHPKKIYLIIGPTGSGTTISLPAPSQSFSQSFADDVVDSVSGTSNGLGSWYNLPRQKRESILFYSPYNALSYTQVLQCVLEHELSLFHAVDQTEVGKKGVYSDAEVVFSDDNVGGVGCAYLDMDCELMKGGDGDSCALALSAARFGVAKQEVMKHTLTIASSSASSLSPLPSSTGQRDENKYKKARIPMSMGRENLLSRNLEEVPVGHVSWSAIKLTGIGGRFPIIFFTTCLGSIVISQLAMVFQMYYLGYWASQYEDRDSRTM